VVMGDVDTAGCIVSSVRSLSVLCLIPNIVPKLWNRLNIG